MNGDRFIERAKEVCADYLHVRTEEMYVVLFCKTLQNWKALVSTDIASGLYFEVTYNGDKNQIYLDEYKKENNICIENAME